MQGRKEVDVELAEGHSGLARLGTEGKNGDQTDAPQPGNAAPMIRVETLGTLLSESAVVSCRVLCSLF